MGRCRAPQGSKPEREDPGQLQGSISERDNVLTSRMRLAPRIKTCKNPSNYGQPRTSRRNPTRTHAVERLAHAWPDVDQAQCPKGFERARESVVDEKRADVDDDREQDLFVPSGVEQGQQRFGSQHTRPHTHKEVDVVRDGQQVRVRRKEEMLARMTSVKLYQATSTLPCSR